MSAVLKPKTSPKSSPEASPEPTLELAATMTSKGQITLPVALRERLGLVAGTKIKFVHDATGTRLVAEKPISAYRGFLKHLGPIDTTIPKEPDRDFDYILGDMTAEQSRRLREGPGK